MNIFSGYGFTGTPGEKNILWKIGFGHECFGKSICRNNMSEVCSGHGKCVNYNKCHCDKGYYGEECQFTTCFGTNSTHPNVCNGRGICIEKDTCSCSTYPSTPTLWGGPECQYPKCFGKLSTENGVCSNHGNCIAPDECQCNSGYAGDFCQLAICFGKVSNDPTVCSSRGYCTQPNQCICNEGYIGEECQIPICFDKNATDESVCSGNGECIEYNKCNCNQTHYGQQCEQKCPIPMITSSRYTVDATKIRIIFNIQMDTQLISNNCSDLFDDAYKFFSNSVCE